VPSSSSSPILPNFEQIIRALTAVQDVVAKAARQIVSPLLAINAIAGPRPATVMSGTSGWGSANWLTVEADVDAGIDL
jgi:amino acid permease